MYEQRIERNRQTRNQQTRGSEPSYNFRNLDVWQRAQTIAEHVVRLSARLPSKVAPREISRQVVRSAGSVAANIAEGHGRFTRAAYRNHLSIAKASACETDSWLDLLKRCGFVSEQEERELHREILGVIAILTAKIRQLDEQLGRPGKIGEEHPEYFTGTRVS